MALMTSWKRGRDLLLARWRQDSLPLASFLARLPQSRTIRVPGMAVFLTGNPDYVPAALLHNLKHNKVLHERVLFVTVQNVDVPEVPPTSGARSRNWRPASIASSLRYGFMESPNMPRDAGGAARARACRSTRCRRAISSAARRWSRRWCRGCRCGGFWLFLLHGAQRRPRPRSSSASRATAWWSWACGWRSERCYR